MNILLPRCFAADLYWQDKLSRRARSQGRPNAREGADRQTTAATPRATFAHAAPVAATAANDATPTSGRAQEPNVAEGGYAACRPRARPTSFLFLGVIIHLLSGAVRAIDRHV